MGWAPIATVGPATEEVDPRTLASNVVVQFPTGSFVDTANLAPRVHLWDVAVMVNVEPATRTRT